MEDMEDQQKSIEEVSEPIKDKHSYIVKLRGLPWSASFKDIEEFFNGCKIKNGARGCIFNNAKDGRPSGEAYVELESKDDFEEALSKDKKYMDNRYVEVFEAERDDFSHYKRKYGDEHDNLVRLRGLPYKCTIEEIEDFFSAIVPDGITLPKDEEGRCSEAFVQFKDYESLEAGLKKHKGKMGHRYIEVFMSSLKELEFVLTSARIKPLMSLKPDPYKEKMKMSSQMLASHQKLIKMIAASNLSVMEKKQMLAMMNNLNPNPLRFNISSMNMMLPINNMMDMVNKMQSSKKGNWVKLRGLPFTADEEDIIKFFRPFKPVNVTIDLDDKGRVSGEAYAEFPNNDIAIQVVDEKNRQNIGHRYIELFLENPNDEDDIKIPQMLNMMMGGGGMGPNHMYGGMHGPRGIKNDFNNKFKRNRRESFDDEDANLGFKHNDGEGHYKRRMPFEGRGVYHSHRPIPPRFGRPGMNGPFKMMGGNFPRMPNINNNGPADFGLRFRPGGHHLPEGIAQGGPGNMLSSFANNMLTNEMMGGSMMAHNNSVIPLNQNRMGNPLNSTLMGGPSNNFTYGNGSGFTGLSGNNLPHNMGHQGQSHPGMMGYGGSNKPAPNSNFYNVGSDFEPLDGTGNAGNGINEENTGITYYPNINLSSMSGNLGALLEMDHQFKGAVVEDTHFN